MISEESCDTEEWSKIITTKIMTFRMTLKYKEIENSNNISQYYWFYSIFDQKNAVLVSIRDFKKCLKIFNNIKKYTDPKVLNGSVCLRHKLQIECNHWIADNTHEVWICEIWRWKIRFSWIMTSISACWWGFLRIWMRTYKNIWKIVHINFIVRDLRFGAWQAPVTV